MVMSMWSAHEQPRLSLTVHNLYIIYVLGVEADNGLQSLGLKFPSFFFVQIAARDETIPWNIAKV